MRRDVERNRSALVRAAIAVLAEDPGASMDRIAEAAGVGRATLYRHFPGREDLLGAILGTVVEESRRIVAAVLVPGHPPAEALGAMCRELAELGERYRFLAAHRAEVRALEARLDRGSTEPLVGFVTAARDAGELDVDVPPAMAPYLLRGVLSATLDAVQDGELPADASAALVERAFLRSLGHRPA